MAKKSRELSEAEKAATFYPEDRLKPAHQSHPGVGEYTGPVKGPEEQEAEAEK